MFSAVEEPDDYGGIHVKFTNFQGDFTWFIAVPENIVGGSNLISYCPWCGATLPKGPFIQAD